jgi:hypothetical protein
MLSARFNHLINLTHFHLRSVHPAADIISVVTSMPVLFLCDYFTPVGIKLPRNFRRSISNTLLSNITRIQIQL